MHIINDIIKKHCGIEVSDDQELIKSKILNSFQFFEVICELEEVYGINLSPEEIGKFENFSTIKNIVAMLKNKGINDEI